MNTQHSTELRTRVRTSHLRRTPPTRSALARRHSPGPVGRRADPPSPRVPTSQLPAPRRCAVLGAWRAESGLGTREAAPDSRALPASPEKGRGPPSWRRRVIAARVPVIVRGADRPSQRGNAPRSARECKRVQGGLGTIDAPCDRCRWVQTGPEVWVRIMEGA
ncbi:hypothetical protein C8Q78DRAFT_205870 [Trametes maxima]|nr:hypothetical protein C8Q78DRAFT_205870 [Trametes maxima]